MREGPKVLLFPLPRRNASPWATDVNSLLDRLFPVPRHESTAAKSSGRGQGGRDAQAGNAREVSDLPAQDMHEEEKPRERSGPAGYWRIRSIDLRRDAA